MAYLRAKPVALTGDRHDELQEATMGTLYEDIGGEQALGTIVQEFSAKVLEDPRLTGYFSGIDVPKLRRNQLANFAVALGAQGVRPRKRASQEHEAAGSTTPSSTWSCATWATRCGRPGSPRR